MRTIFAGLTDFLELADVAVESAYARLRLRTRSSS